MSFGAQTSAVLVRGYEALKMESIAAWTSILGGALLYWTETGVVGAILIHPKDHPPVTFAESPNVEQKLTFVIAMIPTAHRLVAKAVSSAKHVSSLVRTRSQS